MKSLIFMLLLFPFYSYAVESLDFTIHQEYASTRALAMGNAFTALADDHSALYYNSAALARRKDGQLRMFVRAGISEDILSFTEDLGNIGDTEDITQIGNFMAEHYGEHLYMRVPTIGGMLVRPGWGMSLILADISTDISLHRQAGPSLNLNMYADTTFSFAYAWNLRKNLDLGVHAKVINRLQIGESLSAADISNDSDYFQENRVQEGITADADVGLLWDPDVQSGSWYSYFVPKTVGVNIRNIADYGFPIKAGLVSNGDVNEDPSNLQRRLDIGVLYDLPNFWVFDPHFLFDIRDIGHENWNLMKGLHAGVELYWTMFSWWKGSWAVGLNQGYLTAGVGARFAWFQIDIATWGEEVGTQDSPLQNRRYLVELSLDF